MPLFRILHAIYMLKIGIAKLRETIIMFLARLHTKIS